MNRHQPNKKLIKFCRGEGGEGLYGRPRPGPCAHLMDFANRMGEGASCIL